MVTHSSSASSVLHVPSVPFPASDERAGDRGPDSVFLRAKGPFDLGLTLGSGQTFRWQVRDGWHYGVVGRSIWKVRPAQRGLELASSPERPEAVVPHARAYFRLEDDLAGIYGRLGKDPRVAKAIRNYRGLRLVRQDPWECLVSFMIATFSNIRRISKHIGQISERYGDKVTLDGLDMHTFPTPGQMAELREEDFRVLGLGYRSRYLSRLAESYLASGLDFAALRLASYEEAKAELLGIYGVGEKVADCVLLFSLDKLQACPVDVWVRRVLTEWYFPGQKVTDRMLREWAASWFGQDAGYAQQYLFHQRRLQGKVGKKTTGNSASD